MAKKKSLSERQKNILKFIWQSIQDSGRPPTIREIGGATNISSTSVVNYNLNILQDRGFIRRDSEVSRGLQLTEKARALYETAREVVHNMARVVRVPLVGDIVASEPVQLGHEDFASYDEEDAVEISPTMLPNAEDLYALRVRGDSMIDAMVNDGDIVVMKPVNEAKNGEMVAVWLDSGEMTLKHFYNEGTQVRLQPANPTMEPIYVHPGSVQVQGKVMMVMRQTA